VYVELNNPTSARVFFDRIWILDGAKVPNGNQKYHTIGRPHPASQRHLDFQWGSTKWYLRYYQTVLGTFIHHGLGNGWFATILMGVLLTLKIDNDIQ
jgi:hypothetical protein